MKTEHQNLLEFTFRNQDLEAPSTCHRHFKETPLSSYELLLTSIFKVRFSKQSGGKEAFSKEQIHRMNFCSAYSLMDHAQAQADKGRKHTAFNPSIT